jgi:hypothetical protein
VKNRTKVSIGLGFPKQMTMTHKYVETVQMNVGAATGVGSYLFSCNGMYDPNVTSTGHQPMYFDQMSALYDHYVVIGSVCKVKFIPGTAVASNTPMRLVGFINDNNTFASSSNINTLEEASLAKKLTTSPNNNRPLSMTLKWSAKKFFGGSIMANTELQGTAAANPTEQSYFALAALAVDGVSPIDMYVEVEIKYIAVWKELIDIGGS